MYNFVQFQLQALLSFLLSHAAIADGGQGLRSDLLRPTYDAPSSSGSDKLAD